MYEIFDVVDRGIHVETREIDPGRMISLAGITLSEEQAAELSRVKFYLTTTICTFTGCLVGTKVTSGPALP